MSHTSDERLGSENLWKLILAMGIPVMMAQIINILYNIVDRIYIGHIKGAGASALTGVGLALPIITLITAFSSFVGAGGAPLAAIALGAGEKDRANRILGNGVTMLLGFSVILTIIFQVLKQPILYAIGGSDVTYPYARDYLTIYLCGTIFVQLIVGLNSFITAQGKAKTAMMSVIIGAVCNIILDPIFIFGMDLGVKGAALATIISQAVSMIWILMVLLSKNAVLRIQIKHLRPDWKVIGSVAALGVSPFVMQATESMISIVMNSGLKHYGGDLHVGSLTILQSVIQLIVTPVNGFAQGVQPIISYNYGAGKLDRVKGTYRKLIFLTFLVSFLSTLVAMLRPAWLGAIFTTDEELIALVKQILPIFVCGMLIFGVQMGCQSVFMALGQAKISLFIALLRKVILLIPLALILPVITNDVMGIYYAEPIADITAATICGCIFVFSIKKIMKRRMLEHNVQ